MSAMIENFGIGIDISSIKKFEKKPFKQNENFYKKSIHKKIFFSEIETSYSDSTPIVKILNSEQNYRFLASLSHENGIAVAVVISEKII